MEHRLDHFERAQAHVIGQAIEEIRSGKKTGHWILYVFPQMKGLGKSGMSETYAIQDKGHAHMYMSNPILRTNYRCCCQAILDSGKSVYEIFGDDASVSVIPVFKQLKSITGDIMRFLNKYLLVS